LHGKTFEYQGLPALSSPRRVRATKKWKESPNEQKPPSKFALVSVLFAMLILPLVTKDNRRVLVHAHGGPYTMNSARSGLLSSVPAADATGLRVISIDYTVAKCQK